MQLQSSYEESRKIVLKGAIVDCLAIEAILPLI